jgi:histidyl-tRNA synthetase
MADKPAIPTGTRDFAPAVMLRREFIFSTIRNVFRKYGYAPLETPSMELLSVLTGKYGEEGDRLIFKILNNGNFLDKVDPELLSDPVKLSHKICERALRYDLTVPFARFVVMNQHALAFPFKRYQIQPVWRADRPQRGRYREFYQCDADAVGSESLLFEAEFIAIYDEALSRLGLTDYTIKINHRQILTAYAEAIGQPDEVVNMCVAMDKLDKIGKDGVRKELTERGFSPESTEQLFELIAPRGNTEAQLAFLESAFSGIESGKKGIAELREIFALHQHLDAFGGKIEFDPTLARGLNYYTGAVFEVKANGVQIGSIGGGGRYADLTGLFGLPNMPGVGISFGADRVYDVMEELGLFETISSSPVKALIVNFGTELTRVYLSLLSELRQKGIAAELYPDAAKLKKQFAYADKKAVPFLVLAGSEEVEKGVFQLKDMHSGEQVTLSREALLERLQA